ncbi:HEAT repeat domain-containing protein [Planctobacterium marinum]|uniref:Vitellogenin domain-containing protein n=1 Tax=Planctobacterium marinum TaxID=1631968 RepID=A0AA48KSJ7_9ALTE|nr:hypothetical protein MACH26_41940 [Planctobacterium marinum]
MILRLSYFLLIGLVCNQTLASSSTAQSCTRSYELNIDTATHFDFGSGSSNKQTFSAQLSLMALDAETTIPDSTWWGVQLSEIEMQGNGKIMVSTPELSMPFALLKQDDGKLIEFRFAPQHDDSTKQQLQGLAYYLQFPNEAHWPENTEQREESDTIGLYSVRYEKPSTFAGQTVLPYRKNKTHYQSNENMKINGGNPIQTIEINTSQQDIALNSCWFDTVQGQEDIKFSGTADSFSMSLSQTYMIKPMQTLAEVALWAMPTNVNDWVFPEAVVTELTEAEIKALEQRFIKALKDTDLLSMRGSQLADWLLQFDPVISVLREELLTTRFDDKQKMRLFNALGHLDSDNGNQLLVTLINDVAFSETDRFRAIRAITTGTSALTAPLKNQLSGLLNQDEFIGSEALYGAAIMTLGAVLQRRKHNTLSDELFMELTQRLVNAEDEQQQSALVASLGNSQMPEAVTTLQDFAQSSSARVRANVAASFGQIADNDAQQALKSMLQNEPNDKVQQAVLGAIGQFQLNNTELQKISEIAQQSKSERTRGNAIKALAQQTHKSQQAQQQLRQLMMKETSRRNFALAAKSIEALKQTAETDP